MDAEKIEQEALRLREIDRKLVEAILKDDKVGMVVLTAEFDDVRRQLRTAQIEPTVVPIASREALAVLRQLRDGKPFHADRVIDKYDFRSDEELLIDELSDDEIDQLGSDLFYSWFSHYEYIRSLYSLGTLIMAASIPDSVRKYVSEARQCYAFQQYHAVLALCRAFIEAVARDICERRGLIGSDDKAVIRIDERKFNPLINAVAKGELRKRSKGLYYGFASPVVHGARSVGEADARRALKETLFLVEDLYRANGLSGASEDQ